jgi:hypothetical protein
MQDADRRRRASLLRSIVAIVGGSQIGTLVDQWIVFPVILGITRHVPQDVFNTHRTAYFVAVFVLEVGSVVAANGLFIGFVAPRRAGLHALIAGVLGGIASLALGRKGAVTTTMRIVAYVVQTALVVLLARAIERRRSRSALSVDVGDTRAA